MLFQHQISAPGKGLQGSLRDYRISSAIRRDFPFSRMTANN